VNFDPDPTHVAFREEVRKFMRENVPPELARRAYIGGHPPLIEDYRRWQRIKHSRGWGAPHWPVEYGGTGWSAMQKHIFMEELYRADALDYGWQGTHMIGPVLIAFGSEAQKRRFLPPMLCGEEYWCQGFSEPNAGSDLAAVRTRAELRGDTFHVSGQKIWTSYARFADWCILVVRTDVHAPKHKGLSFLLADMKSPGITIRPLVEMTGVAWFNEVFFDDVRVPREHMVGELNQGWQIAITTLAHERGGSAPHARLAGEMHDVLDLARRLGTASDRRWRQRLAQSFIETEILRLLAYKQVTDLMREGHPGPEGSYLKLVWSETDARMKELALEMEGPYGALARGSPRAIDAGRWEYEYLWARAATIYAGTSEVQRNVIAQRVLGLPRGT